MNVKLLAVGDDSEKSKIMNAALQLGIMDDIYFAVAVFDDYLFTEYFLRATYLSCREVLVYQ